MKISVRDMTLVALFAGLMVVGAFLKIDFPITPLTFQPFFCALAGVLLGARLGALSMSIYVAMGLIGLPVFSKGGGITYIFNYTFGYLIGFIIGAYVIGKIVEKFKSDSFAAIMTALVAGLAVIYAIGIPYTYMILKFYMNKPNVLFYSATLTPIILKDLILYIVIAITTRALLPILRKAGLKLA